MMSAECAKKQNSVENEIQRFTFDSINFAQFDKGDCCTTM